MRLNSAAAARSALPADVRAAHPLKIRERKTGRQAALYAGLARALGIEREVELGGYVPEECLASLYRRAAVLVYPSLDEGYGYPPLEALARGTPAIVSDRGALPEVAGRAGASVVPLREAVFAEEIVRVLNGGAKPGPFGAKANGACVTRREYGERLLEIYEERF